MKPPNILVKKVGDQDVFVLTDFGISKIKVDGVATTTTMKANTPPYSSEESLRLMKSHWSFDIWAIGCILFEMMTGVTPYESPYLNNIEQNLRSCPLPITYSQELRDLVNLILTRGQDNSPTIGQVLKTPIVFDELANIIQSFLPLTE
jgi:serine/threonine protein kinase